MKLCAEGCCRLRFALFPISFQEIFVEKVTKPKLPSNNVSHTVLPHFFSPSFLHNFMPRFPFYVTHHLWEWISTCGTNLPRANEFHRWLESLRAKLSSGTESRYSSLAEVTVACIVTEGTMFTFWFLRSDVFISYFSFSFFVELWTGIYMRRRNIQQCTQVMSCCCCCCWCVTFLDETFVLHHSCVKTIAKLNG